LGHKCIKKKKDKQKKMDPCMTNTILELLQEGNEETPNVVQQPTIISPESPSDLSTSTDSSVASGDNSVKKNKRSRRRGGRGKKKKEKPKKEVKSGSLNWRQKEEEEEEEEEDDPSLPKRVMPVESELCKSEKKHYKKNIDGDILYKGKTVCRFNMTSRGCRNGAKCKFLHIKLACAYHRAAAQGCIYPAEDCPFSHSDDAVMVSPPVKVCPNCNANHCFGSICLRCNTVKTKERREYTKKLCSKQKNQLEKGKRIRFISNPPIEAKTLVFDERGDKWGQPAPQFVDPCKMQMYNTESKQTTHPVPSHMPFYPGFNYGMFPHPPPGYMYGYVPQNGAPLSTN
jgi:hypothetical protein